MIPARIHYSVRRRPRQLQMSPSSIGASRCEPRGSHCIRGRFRLLLLLATTQRKWTTGQQQLYFHSAALKRAAREVPSGNHLEAALSAKAAKKAHFGRQKHTRATLHVCAPTLGGATVIIFYYLWIIIKIYRHPCAIALARARRAKNRMDAAVAAA